MTTTTAAPADRRGRPVGLVDDEREVVLVAGVPARVERAGLLVVDARVVAEDLDDLGRLGVLEVLARPSRQASLAPVLEVLLGLPGDASCSGAPRRGACCRCGASSRSDTRAGASSRVAGVLHRLHRCHSNVRIVTCGGPGAAGRRPLGSSPWTAMLRIGLVGLGDIAVRAHSPAIAREPRTTLVAVADTRRRAARGVRAARACARRPTPSPCSPIPDVDAVVIATPPAATAGLVRAALEAGKYVLAEKPLALSLAEAAGVRDAPGAAERLQIGLTYRHHPAVDRLRELIAAGALGRPLLIQAAICDEPAEPGRGPARLRAAAALARAAAADRLGRRARLRPAQLPARRGTRRGLGLEPAHRPRLRDARTSTAASSPTPTARSPGSRSSGSTPVLPPSQFVVTGPLGRATLDPPTFRLDVELADGTTRDARAAGRQDRGLLRAPARALRRARASPGTPPVPGLDEALASLELAERIAHAAGVARRGAGVIDFHVHQPAGAAYGPEEYVAGDGRARRRRLGRLHLRRAAPADARRRTTRSPRFVARRAGAAGRVRDRRPARPRRRRRGRALRRASTACAASSSIPWLQGFSAHEPGLQDRLRDGRPARGPDPLPRRHAAVLDAAPARVARAPPSGDDRSSSATAACTTSGARRSQAVLTTDERPPLHVRHARLRDAGDRRALPARAAALRHRRRAAAGAAASATPRCASASSTSSASTTPSARRSSTPTRAGCSPHDRHPLARPDPPRPRPAGRARRQRQVAARPAR